MGRLEERFQLCLGDKGDILVVPALDHVGLASFSDLVTETGKSSTSLSVGGFVVAHVQPYCTTKPCLTQA